MISNESTASMDTTSSSANLPVYDAEMMSKPDPDFDTDAKWFDLYPNRSLMDASFEGYKLTLDSFPQYKLPLTTDAHLDTYNFIESSDSKLKYLLFQHLKLFGFENLLVVNQFRDSDVYYFDASGRLVRIIYVDGLSPTNTVRGIEPTNLKIPAVSSTERTSISMKFVRADLAVVFDGFMSLHVCECKSGQDWRVAFSWNAEARPGVIKDAVLADGQLHVVIVYIDEVKDEKKPNKFETIVSWIQFESVAGETAEWTWKRTRKLNSYNSVPDFIG